MEKFVFLCCGILILLGACNRNNRNLSISDEQSFKVSVKGGEEWLHDFPLLLGIKMRNPPQLAIWIEDIHGKYLSTVYVTRKIATQSWIMSGFICLRRKSLLWMGFQVLLPKEILKWD